MSDFGTIKSRIADDIARADLTTQIATAVQNAIDYYDRERFWFNEAIATASTVASTQNLDVPTDFIAADTLRVTINSSKLDLTRRTKAYIDAITVTASHTGQPSDYAVYNQDLWLWPIPAAVYTLTLTYHKSLAALSGASDTNAWMTEGEQLIRNRAEWELYAYVVRDPDMAALCKAAEMEALQSLKSETGRYVASGGIMPHSW